MSEHLSGRTSLLAAVRGRCLLHLQAAVELLRLLNTGLQSGAAPAACPWLLLGTPSGRAGKGLRAPFASGRRARRSILWRRAALHGQALSLLSALRWLGLRLPLLGLGRRAALHGQAFSLLWAWRFELRFPGLWCWAALHSRAIPLLSALNLRLRLLCWHGLWSSCMLVNGPRPTGRARSHIRTPLPRTGTGRCICLSASRVEW